MNWSAINEALGAIPELESAACSGRPELVDALELTGRGARLAELTRRANAKAICHRCPALAACREWGASLPASRRAGRHHGGGVVQPAPAPPAKRPRSPQGQKNQPRWRNSHMTSQSASGTPLAAAFGLARDLVVAARLLFTGEPLASFTAIGAIAETTRDPLTDAQALMPGAWLAYYLAARCGRVTWIGERGPTGRRPLDLDAGFFAGESDDDARAVDVLEQVLRGLTDEPGDSAARLCSLENARIAVRLALFGHGDAIRHAETLARAELERLGGLIPVQWVWRIQLAQAELLAVLAGWDAIPGRQLDALLLALMDTETVMRGE